MNKNDYEQYMENYKQGQRERIEAELKTASEISGVQVRFLKEGSSLLERAYFVYQIGVRTVRVYWNQEYVIPHFRVDDTCYEFTWPENIKQHLIEGRFVDKPLLSDAIIKLYSEGKL